METEVVATTYLDPADRLLSQKEVAERLESDRAFVKDMLDLGILQCIYFGNRRRVSAFDLNDLIVRFKGKDLRAYTLGLKKGQGMREAEGNEGSKEKKAAMEENPGHYCCRGCGGYPGGMLHRQPKNGGGSVHRAGR